MAPTGATQRLLVIRAGALGDCLLMLPTLTALRTAFPQARIDVMGYPGRWAWVRGRGLVNHIHSIEQPGMHRLFCDGVALPEGLAALFGTYDTILSYRPDPEGLFAANLRRLGAGLVLSQSPFPPPPPPRLHAADFALQLTAQLGVSSLPVTPRLPLTAAELALVQPFFTEHRLNLQSDRLVVLHPGSGSAAKRWPLVNVAAVTEALAEQAGVIPIIVTGYAEETTATELRSLLRRAPPLRAENWSLLPTAALIAYAAVFIGNDSGLTHLAAALGRPTVAIFGPTDPEIWGPRGDCVTIVRGKTGEAGGQEWGWPDVSSVLQAVQRWLARP